MCDVEHHCYNLGCGKKFKETSNHAKACTFHSGKPYFHDAYKVIWVGGCYDDCINQRLNCPGPSASRRHLTCLHCPFVFSIGLAVIVSPLTFPSLWPLKDVRSGFITKRNHPSLSNKKSLTWMRLIE